MTIGVIGAGAWGTAIAAVMARDQPVTVWAMEAEVVSAINDAQENTLYLPGATLPRNVRATGDLSELASADTVFVVTPAQHLRATLTHLPTGGGALVLCAKGIEADTLMLLHEVAAELHPERAIHVMSGPTFAREVADGLPTAVTLAHHDRAAADAMAARIARPTLRPYPSTDVVGAEIGGAVKNVLAIACGVVEGAGLGQNARAALIARGFAEMTRFGLARGARAETLAGLSGLGDLVLTCSSTASRNFSLGVGLGRGERAAVLLADRRTVAEGASTAPVLRAAAARAGVDMPITAAVCRLLAGESACAVIDDLLTRPIRAEG